MGLVSHNSVSDWAVSRGSSQIRFDLTLLSWLPVVCDNEFAQTSRPFDEDVGKTEPGRPARPMSTFQLLSFPFFIHTDFYQTPPISTIPAQFYQYQNPRAHPTYRVHLFTSLRSIPPVLHLLVPPPLPPIYSQPPSSHITLYTIHRKPRPAKHFPVSRYYSWIQ